MPKFDVAIKKDKDLIWFTVSGSNDSEATKKANEILKDRKGYKLYAGPLPKHS